MPGSDVLSGWAVTSLQRYLECSTCLLFPGACFEPSPPTALMGTF